MSAISSYGRYSGFHGSHGGSLSSARARGGAATRSTYGGNSSASYSSSVSRSTIGSGTYRSTSQSYQGQSLQGAMRGNQTSTNTARQTSIGSANVNRGTSSYAPNHAGGTLGSGRRVGGYTTTTQRGTASSSTSGVCIPCGYNRR